MLDFSVLEPYFPLLASAVWITLKFTFFSTIMGFLALAFMSFSIGFDMGLVLSKGIIISLFHNRTLEIKWPACVALGYCLCFFAISLICGGKTVSENLTTYLMILFLISSTAVVGYILAYTKRRKTLK